MIEYEVRDTRIHLDLPNAIEWPADQPWPFKHKCLTFQHGKCVDCASPLPEGTEVARLTWL